MFASLVSRSKSRIDLEKALRRQADTGGPAQPMLIVESLRKHFRITGAGLHPSALVKAVDGIDFSLCKNETLGIVGESGCGKSTTARLLMHLVPPDEGRIILDGLAVGAIDGISVRDLRQNVQMVFQDSYASLNPRLTLEEAIAFGPRIGGASARAAKERARAMLQRVGLPPDAFLHRYPHELSGGQRQRVNIARALAMEPRVLILDEAVSALDKSIEAQILNLLQDIKDELSLTYIFISHDLDVVRHICDRVLVMYLGKVVEVGPAQSLYDDPQHPYTRALLSSRLTMDPTQRRNIAPLVGDPPSPIDPPSGCRFRTRCHLVEEVCASLEPLLVGNAGDPSHRTACHVTAPGPGSTDSYRFPSKNALPEPAQESVSAAPSGVPAEAKGQPLVQVRDLNVSFTTRRQRLAVINGVSFDLHRGEVLCLLGESGSGKSVTMRSLMRLLPPHALIEGAIRIGDADVLALRPVDLRRLRGPVASMIFQEPATALDPTFSIGSQIIEAVRAHEPVSEAQARQRALDLLELVQIPSAKRRLDAYPFELSGGLRQRAMIALALSCRPQLLLADEPTTALDATVQIQVLLLLRRLQRELGMAIIFVTHDIGVACEISDRIAVMYAGRIVEMGATQDVITRPAHPYTRGLLGSVVGTRAHGKRLAPIPGTPPDIAALPPGCSFAPRCADTLPRCRESVPPFVDVSAGHAARCILAEAPACL